jgi:hypothetical protein
MVMLKKLLRWWNKATPEERTRLAEIAQSQRTYIRSHVISGRRSVSPDFAARIEEGVRAINMDRYHADQLPHLDRRDLCETCAQCPLARNP